MSDKPLSADQGNVSGEEKSQPASYAEQVEDLARRHKDQKRLIADLLLENQRLRHLVPCCLTPEIDGTRLSR